MDASFASKPPRRGFTLVEMLAVIMIIGILVALLLPAIQAARNRAKIASISLEISQLDMALKRYKEEFGDYPPDFFGVRPHPNDQIDAQARARTQADVVRHLRKAFPRYVPGDPSNSSALTAWLKVCDDVLQGTGGTMDLNLMTPASAIVFWLGGLPETGGSTKLMGFSANSRNPFDPGEDRNGNGTLDAGEDSNNNGVLDRGTRLPALFDFSEPRIKLYSQGDWPTYGPEGVDTNSLPYVYFKPRTNSLTGHLEYGLVNGSTFMPHHHFHPFNKRDLADPQIEVDLCVPYLEEPDPGQQELSLADLKSLQERSRKWRNASSFQIIAGGLDNLYGDGYSNSLFECLFRYSRTGVYFSENGADHDNITNFSRGKLEDEM